MTTRYIYTLTSDNLKVIWVGATAYPTERVKQHARFGRVGFLTVLETTFGEDWKQTEDLWIAYYRSLGAPLLNKIRGGGGSSLGAQRSPETIDKLRRWERTPEMRERMRQSHVGYKHTEEQKRKNSESHKGKRLGAVNGPHSQEHRAKIGEASRASWARRRELRLTNIPHSQEYRERMAEISRAAWAQRHSLRKDS